MARDWHELFKTWAKPPSETEEEKGSRAATMVNDAVRESGILAGRNFSVHPTGSYRNNTNIRLGSDVDIALVLHDAFFWVIPPGRRAEEFGLGPGATYGLTDFRRDVGRALAAKFGADVTQGNKTFDIAGNSYRLPADATPFLRHREYTGQRNLDGTWHYFEGVETRAVNAPDRRIINWHQDHYDHGVAKNKATNRRYKRIARILKKLREDMMASGTVEAKVAAQPMASFLLECVSFNAADPCFNKVEGTYYEDVKAVICDLWNASTSDAAAASLVEVNRRKALFGAHQSWTRAQVHEFLYRVWNHVGFK
ncbi:MAG: nucleotidyltransferase [Planctomycetes bacterium]|nr:nucleotidyltransferase [Planctomycetota bacterium]